MEIGKLPNRLADVQWVPQTDYDYRDTTLKLLGILSRHLKKEIHMVDFWKFGKEDIVEPQQNIHLWLAEDIKSLGVR